ncbi:hypothetical protein MRX96_001535 [Rhipicephalus microplus]
MLSLGVILLPILLLSRKVQELFLVLFFWAVTTIWFEELDKSKCYALKPLQFIESHDPQIRKQGVIRMLEIGAGMGGNSPPITRPVTSTNADSNAQF